MLEEETTLYLKFLIEMEGSLSEELCVTIGCWEVYCSFKEQACGNY